MYSFVIFCGSRRPGCCCGGVQPFQILVNICGVEKPMINDSLSSTISCASRFNSEKALCNDAGKEEISCQNRDGNKQIMIPSVVISQAL